MQTPAVPRMCSKPEIIQHFPKVGACALTGLLEHQSSLGALGLPSLLCAQIPLVMQGKLGVMPAGIALPPVQSGALGCLSQLLCIHLTRFALLLPAMHHSLPWVWLGTLGKVTEA